MSYTEATMTGIRGCQRQEVTVSYPHARRSIDSSLARSIRRSYFKRLAREWCAYGQRRERAAARNVFLSRPNDTRRQFRSQLALLEKFVGPLLPACTLRVESGTRAAAVIWALHPEEVPASMLVDSHAQIRALTLLQPGRCIGQEVSVRVRAHAVDRVVQRASVVDLPIREDDMQAINAEFSDLLPLACVAGECLAKRAHEAQAQGKPPEPLQILLPTQHGVFLGSWNTEAGQLEVRTFVDHAKLNGAQTEAVREIERIAQDRVCTQALQILVPGWLGSDDGRSLRDELLQAWQHFSWRFEEDRLHPGMSDQAWKHRADLSIQRQPSLRAEHLMQARQPELAVAL
jgi:hypothetical protein